MELLFNDVLFHATLVEWRLFSWNFCSKTSCSMELLLNDVLFHRIFLQRIGSRRSLNSKKIFESYGIAYLSDIMPDFDFEITLQQTGAELRAKQMPTRNPHESYCHIIPHSNMQGLNGVLTRPTVSWYSSASTGCLNVLLCTWGRLAGTRL